MGASIARKLIDAHLVEGDPTPGAEIALKIDQTLARIARGRQINLVFVDRRSARADLFYQCEQG